jgi:preprotein translocase subunit SecF
MKMIIQKRKIWLGISSVLVALSLVFIAMWGLNLGIDFTGGSLLEVRVLENAPSAEEMSAVLDELEFEGSITVQPTNEDGFLIRFQDISEETHQLMLGHLEERYMNEAGETVVQQERYESIGPSIGQELRSKAIYSILIVLIFIVIYIAWAFRKVSYPLKSWKFGIIAIITLFHDIILTLGIFAILGRFAGVEVGLPFVAALLTILGYSVNDTIVVFDRVRENLSRLVNKNFEKVVNRSVNETISRSINTSLTTMLVLLAIFLFGGATIKFFVLALICGVLFGTYSSIFVASPLLVVWEQFKKRD